MGKEEMWKAFKTAILTAKIGEPYDTDLIVYLFSFIDGAPRWVSLLSGWLGMEETRNKFGWVDCPEFEKDIVCTFIECSQRNSGCAITGKIRAEWAR